MGYIGNRMSERAHEAHLGGEKPWSEWRKDDFVDLFDEEIQPLASKLTPNELRGELLTSTGWHHTGKYFNKTDFYEISEDYLQELTADKIAEIIANRPKREKREPKVKEKPLFVTAKIRYIEWEGKYANHRKPVEHVEIVKYMSDAKMVKVDNGWKTKRLSSVDIISKIEQKTKFADVKKLK